MVEAEVIMSPFDSLDFLRCELRKPILEGGGEVFFLFFKTQSSISS